MRKIFNIEEDARIYEIVEEYRAIYENANFIAIQTQKMELEMAELITKMEVLKEEETGIYTVASERTGFNLEEVKYAAGNLILTKQEKMSENI